MFNGEWRPLMMIGVGLLCWVGAVLATPSILTT